jgi:hypothetical protein
MTNATKQLEAEFKCGTFRLKSRCVAHFPVIFGERSVENDMAQGNKLMEIFSCMVK